MMSQNITDVQKDKNVSENAKDIKWLSDQARALCSVGKHNNVVQIFAYNFTREYWWLQLQMLLL